jgi:hypothetical protein
MVVPLLSLTSFPVWLQILKWCLKALGPPPDGIGEWRRPKKQKQKGPPGRDAVVEHLEQPHPKKRRSAHSFQRCFFDPAYAHPCFLAFPHYFLCPQSERSPQRRWHRRYYVACVGILRRQITSVASSYHQSSSAYLR